jgi:hypothetical protein
MARALVLELGLVLVLLMGLRTTTTVLDTRRVPPIDPPMASPASASALALTLTLVHLVHAVVSFVERKSCVARIMRRWSASFA